MESFRIGEIKEVLKTLLKKKKQTYADLAIHLDCSEPTVKRILGNEELTLTRLLQICDFLNVSLGEIEGMIQKGGREEFHLSEKQQMFLVQNKNYFAYLMEIYQGLSTEQIAEKYKLTAKSTQKYLINLEKQTGKLGTPLQICKFAHLLIFKKDLLKTTAGRTLQGLHLLPKPLRFFLLFHFLFH